MSNVPSTYPYSCTMNFDKTSEKKLQTNLQRYATLTTNINNKLVPKLVVRYGHWSTHATYNNINICLP